METLIGMKFPLRETIFRDENGFAFYKDGLRRYHRTSRGPDSFLCLIEED